MASPKDFFLQALLEGRNPFTDMREIGHAAIRRIERIFTPEVLAKADSDPNYQPLTQALQNELGALRRYVDQPEDEVAFQLCKRLGSYTYAIQAWRWMLAIVVNRLIHNLCVQRAANSHSVEWEGFYNSLMEAVAAIVRRVDPTLGNGPLPTDRVTAILTAILEIAEKVNKKTTQPVDTILAKGGFVVPMPSSHLPSVYKKIEADFRAELMGDITTANKQGAVGEVVVKYPDGAVWLNLKCTQSDLEGELMHHCGGSSGGDQLSYREKAPSGKGWQPVYNVGLTHDHRVAQFRGSANAVLDDDPKAWEKLTDLLATAKWMRGTTYGGDVQKSNFTPEQVAKIQSENPGFTFTDSRHVYPGHREQDADDGDNEPEEDNREKCEGCGDRFDEDELNKCEYCDELYCNDCIGGHEEDELWGDTIQVWAYVDGQLVWDGLLPTKWGDNDNEGETPDTDAFQYMAANPDNKYDFDWKGVARRDVEMYYGKDPPQTIFIYSKHDGRLLGIEQFSGQDDWYRSHEPEGVPGRRYVANVPKADIDYWVYQQYGPDVDIEDESRQAKRDAPVKAGKQPLLYQQKESSRALAKRLFQGDR